MRWIHIHLSPSRVPRAFSKGNQTTGVVVQEDEIRTLEILASIRKTSFARVAIVLDLDNGR